MFLLPDPPGAPAGVMHAAGVVVFAIGMWATSAFPEYFTTLIFFFLSMALGIAPADVVFSGFDSGAVWMVLGGLVIGASVQHTGLGKRVAGILVNRARGTYFHVVAGVVVISMLLAFFIPSAAGRIVILLPIVMAVAERFGFRAGSNGYIAMALAVGLGSVYPSFSVLPAAVPNLGLMGAAESLYGIHLVYGEYFYLTFPVVGVATTAFLPVLLCRLFPDTIGSAEPSEPSEAFTGPERRLGIVLLIALLFWVTDFWHGISPAWVALGAAMVLLAPRIGVVPTGILVNKINLGPWFFVAGIIGMGAVVVHSGVGRLVATHLFDWVRMVPGNTAANFATVTGLGSLMALVTGMPGLPAILGALAREMSSATGLPINVVLMMEVGSWLLPLFPYQVPPIVLAIALGRLPVPAVVRTMLCMCLFNLLVTLPLLYGWWRLTGFLGTS